jgi:hypothetical protein
MGAGGPEGGGGGAPPGGAGTPGLAGDGPGGGGPGAPGGGGQRQGGGNADPSTPEGAVEAFLNALVSQDKDALSKGVSSRALGDLAKIRKGEADARVISKLSDTFGKLFVARVAPVTKGDERVVVLSTTQQQQQAKKGTFKQATLRKEDGVWKVFELK